MAIDMSTIREVTPSPSSAEPFVGATVTRVDVESASIAAPQAALAQFLDPLSGAGVGLTRWVLVILGTVLLIILFTLVHEQNVFNDLTGEAYKNSASVSQATPAGSNFPPLVKEGLAPVRDALRVSAEDPPKAAHDSLRKAIAHLEKLELDNKDARSNDEIKRLTAAVRLINGTDDGVRVEPAAALPIRRRIENLMAPTTPDAMETADSLLAKKELLETYMMSAKSTRDFWIQISQMILINLLLPVLTALLGYVFASKNNK